MVRAVYVARHGLRANHDPPPTGIDGDPRLTDEGAQQAEELAKFIASPEFGDNIQAIYSSPFYRCLQTASPASQLLDKPIWVETGIGEYYGVTRPTKPRPWSAARSKSEFFPNIDLSYTPQVAVSPAGETFETLRTRVAKAVEAVLLDADAKGFDTVLIVTHAAVKIMIGEVIAGVTVRAGTASLDKYVPSGHGTWNVVYGGETKYLSGGEQMHWSFDMAYEAGSAADEASRASKKDAPSRAAPPEAEAEVGGTRHTIEKAPAPSVGGAASGSASGASASAAAPSTEMAKAYISLDTSSLPASEQPQQLDNIEYANLETDRPVVRIGPKLYEGEWQRVIGTELYTAENGEPLGSSQLRIRLFPAQLEDPRSRPSLRDRLKASDAAAANDASAHETAVNDADVMN